MDKSTTDNKENSVPSAAAAPLSTSKTSSMGTFSFALGNSIGSPAQPVSEIASKSLTSPATVATAALATSPLATALTSPPSTTTATPLLAAVPSSTPSSAIGFSFAQASAESSIFGGATAATNITAATTTSSAVVSSSTDPSNIFQGFNICKPNVPDSSNSKSPYLFFFCKKKSANID